MKKSIALFLCLLLLGSTVAVSADDFKGVNLEFQLGSHVAFIDGETVPTQAPFLKDGVTVASVELLSKAFGAESKDTIKYNNIDIIFNNDSKYAVVLGEIRELPTKVVEVNGSLMVPVRFVCDIFNVLIEFEEQTGIIKLSKSADFSEIFNKPASGYWCDEDYGWMINLPEGYSWKKGEYDGSENMFINSEGDAAFVMYVMKNTFQNINQVENSLLSQGSGFLLVSRENLMIDGDIPAVYNSYEDFAQLATIYGDYFFVFEFITSGVSTYKKYAEEGENGLKSLTFKIDQTKSPENISQYNPDGYVMTANKTLGFSVKRMENWTEPESIASNIVTWSSKNYTLVDELYSDQVYYGKMTVEVYSVQKNDTHKSLAKDEEKWVKNRYNPENLFDVYTQEVTSGEETGTELSYMVYYNGRVQINKTRFFVISDYYYKLSYYMVCSDTLNPADLDLDKVYKMFSSIKVTGVNATSLGKVLQTSRLIDENVMQSFENEYKNFAIDIPAAWKTYVDAYEIISNNKEDNMSVGVMIIPGVSNLETAKNLVTENAENCTFKKTTFGGKRAYFIETKGADKNGNTINAKAYVFVQGKNAYCIAYSIKEIYESSNNLKLLNKIVKSFKLL